MQQSFSATDDITNINSDVIYYRLKVIGKAGEIKYSNILVIRKSQSETTVTVMPNPANDYVLVNVFAEKEGNITIRLIDNTGKTILLQNQKITRGNKIIILDNLAKYSAGVYNLQVFINDELVNKKLIILRK